MRNALASNAMMVGSLFVVILCHVIWIVESVVWTVAEFNASFENLLYSSLITVASSGITITWNVALSLFLIAVYLRLQAHRLPPTHPA
ncbi:hypothetical protein BH23VER1_BH23VER1_16160 [soil metagenome]